MIETVLMNLKSTGVFIAVLSILIIVHEWGHYITAKRMGVAVQKFSLGFGPKVFSWRSRETEFLVCLIPLGGYVKMAGDIREECKGTPEEFYSKPPGKRALIVLNGPMINFALAYICLVLVFIFGYPDMSNRVGELIADYPAQQAGLLVDDKIVQVNDTAVHNWGELQATIMNSSSDEISVTVLRGEETLILRIIPKTDEMKNIFGQVKRTRIIGIRPAQEIAVVKYPVGESFIKAYQKLAEITTLTCKSIYFMLTGSMSAKESMTGPIGIFYIIKAAAEMGFTHVLFITGVISASLAIFNLLPVIPLDGGHLFLLGIEKLRGQALPQKIDDYIARVGFSLIILLAIFVFYSDFSRFGWIDKIRHFLF